MAWKGQEASQIELTVTIEGEKRFEWFVRLTRQSYEFYIEEYVQEIPPGNPPIQLLSAEMGRGWWWSGEKGERVNLLQGASTCALAAASADASFPARELSEFIEKWGFFDPSPFLLRRDWNLADSNNFDPYGRNLGETLYALKASCPEVLDKVISATHSIVGLPTRIEPRESEDRFYFVQDEPGLRFPVNQMGVSSGTLRVLALMTALYGQPGTALIGIEEPENYIHPSALSSLVDHVISARHRAQFMVTTHSPLLLDFVNEPAAVNVVRRDEMGTCVLKENDPDGVRRALEASGFGLGEYYETKGFGG